jgi:zeaxanthin glucosyltransferase
MWCGDSIFPMQHSGVHFGVIAPPFPSHTRALEALAGALIDCGHAVTWIHQVDARQFLADRRIAYCAVGARSHPAGSLQPMLRRAAHPRGPLGLRRVIADMARSTAMLCNEAPAVIRALGITAVIADQMEAAGGLVADSLQLPFVSVACALPVNREPAVPLPVMLWGYAPDAQRLELNKTSARVYDWLMQPHARVIAAQAKAFGLPPKQSIADCLSPLAQLSQTTAGFDFPRTMLPAHFHHVGPLRGAARNSEGLNFPIDPLRPFVFASLGTLQGGRIRLFLRIARACKLQAMQLLVAHCNQLDARQEDQLKSAGATWVTGFADQQAAVARADVVVTHGGLNTALDALAAGTPLLVLPIAFDQPGVAARVVYAGAGLRLSAVWSSAQAISRALRRLVEEPAFVRHCERLGDGVRQAGGTAAAARIVLSAIARSPGVKSATGLSRHAEPARSDAYAT